MDKEKGQVWDRVAARLRAELGEEIFTSWFGRVEFEGLDEGVLKLSVPTKFLRPRLFFAVKLRLLFLVTIATRSNPQSTALACYPIPLQPAL